MIYDKKNVKYGKKQEYMSYAIELNKLIRKAKNMYEKN